MGVTAKPMSVEKVPVEGACPECGARALKRYPALSAGGWFQVVKCQDCLASVERTPWNRLGYVDRSHVDVALAAYKGPGE
jgi:vanillate/4-hydroxybenzoate decarboxylase subunit D